MVEKYEGGGKETHIQRNFYDAEELRYGIEEDGERTNFVTNGWSVFTELDAEWNPTKRLVRGYGTIASEEIEQSAERESQSFVETFNQKLAEKYHFYHQNEHGDTEYITGGDGKVKNAYTYDAFGTITNSSELVKNCYTYNGEQYDQIPQQYYLRARNYNPLIGRFTQEDVYRGDGLNLYAYCGNNPVMYVDPSGYVVTDNPVMDTPSDYAERIKYTPKEDASYGSWNGDRGESDFVFSNDGTNLHNKTQKVMDEYGKTSVTYKNGMVDFDDVAAFTVSVKIDSTREVTHPRVQKEIARQIVKYNGDYQTMYKKGIMDIDKPLIKAQEVAKNVILDKRIQKIVNSNVSTNKKIALIASRLNTLKQKQYRQTIHEKNLEKNLSGGWSKQDKNKAQWVPTDMNRTFGHLAGISETNTQEAKLKCQVNKLGG